MAQQAKPAKIVQLGRIPELLGPLPTAGAEDSAQLIYAVACCVSFTEEPDAGNLHVRFCEGH